ncbi:Ras-related protein Rab-40C [Bagarius yarrelli]|uniref:small monomeric GTPase n=1 Tax=Bagarius yarrelli TaxID=175774 RepID=A0A556VX99_BAGYA|nr:Ras-related protein Rab-40C [Bagarius yarrelli]
MVLKIFFPRCCSTADSGLLVGRWIPGQDSVVVLAVVHYPFIPGQVKKYLSDLCSQIQVDLTVVGSWSLSKDGQKEMDSFLKDLSTIFPHSRWLQLSRQPGKRGFACEVVSKNGHTPANDETNKVIFVHYDQRKVMLSQLHPIMENDADVDFPERAAVPPRQIRRRPAEADTLDGREASIIAELIKQASIPVCMLLTVLLCWWKWLWSLSVFNIWPVHFISSKLSTCVQAGCRTDHFQTVFTTRKATTHTDFMRMGSQGSPVKSYDYLLKFLLVGDSDVGKGEILDSLQDGSAESPYAYSSGIDYKTTTILLDGRRGILLVYDITNRWSFDGIDRWIREIDEHAPGVPRILVGNRLHLAFKRQVPTEQARSYAEKNAMTFFEVSPLCNFNVIESFTELSRIVLMRHGMEKFWRPNRVFSLQDLCCRAIVSCTPVHLIDKLPLPVAIKSHLKSFSMANGMNAVMMHGRSYSVANSGGSKGNSLKRSKSIRPPQSPPQNCTRNNCKIS